MWQEADGCKRIARIELLLIGKNSDWKSDEDTNRRSQFSSQNIDFRISIFSDFFSVTFEGLVR